MTKYHPLTEQEAMEIARTIPDLFPAGTELVCREIGDGNLNLVFHVSGANRSVILKQALPYAKVVGESWPLTLDRARIESEALMIEGKHCPTLVPKVYRYDADLALTIMEDLSDHVIMRRGLIEGNRYPLFASHIGPFMARNLFYTSDLGMNQQEKKLQSGRFINPELCKITEDLIFDDPYTDSSNNNYNPAIRDAVQALWSDRDLHLEVARLRQSFLTHGQALLHGDLHTGSIFVTAQSTKVIDPEFAFYGPMGFDIGAVIANLLLNAAGQEGWIEDEEARADFRSYLLDTASEVWASFEATFKQLWEQDLVDRIAATPGYYDVYLNGVLQDAIGYAGCKMIRRVVGLAHVADIDRIEDPIRKEKAERMALAIGRELILHHRKAGSFDELIEIANCHLN